MFSIGEFSKLTGLTVKTLRFYHERGILEHKGYIGRVEFDEDAGMIHGEVINTRDVITFQGASVAEVKKAFHESVICTRKWSPSCVYNTRQGHSWSGQTRPLQRISASP